MDRPFKYDYGQTARIVTHAPAGFRSQERVAVVGMRVVRRKNEATAAGHSVGTHLYTVEYSDGSSVEIPEEYIEPAQ